MPARRPAEAVPVLVVGSVALDTVETPSRRACRVLGGSAVFFASSASLFADVRVVGVVGDDYPLDDLAFLADRGVCLRGVARAPGESFFWSGRYAPGFASRETLETRLGVFASFAPDLPDAYRDSKIVFLGNIDPHLQLRVLDQADAPLLVAADTMDFWIEKKKEALLEVVSRLDVLFCNDEEVRALAGEPNLAEAARWVRERGPRVVVVKKGEHGAAVFGEDWTFLAAAWPHAQVVDPTGAGDAFAGGFLGRLAAGMDREDWKRAVGVDGREDWKRAAGVDGREDWKRAAATGSAMGAFATESFSVDRLRELQKEEVRARVRGLAALTAFEPGRSARAGKTRRETPASPAAGMTYKAAGVDLDAAARAKRSFSELLASTRDVRTLSGLGAFGGCYAVPGDMAEPVLVASADGVGTKLKVAFAAARHDTVGRDLVNHCVNDVLVQGARPLFFLDYLAACDLDDGVARAVVEGVAQGCRDNSCVLLGGETAEMPGFYAPGEYDLAGFVVGAVERGRLLDGEAVRPGHRLVGLASGGLHTNGYTLARSIVSERMGLDMDDPFPGEGDATVADVLLRVHRSYLDVAGPLLEAGALSAMAHVTGGGIEENLPRCLPKGLGARVDCASWRTPRVFETLAEGGRVEAREMYRVFNMGVGMVLVTPPERLSEVLSRAGEAWEMGEVVERPGVELAGA